MRKYLLIFAALSVLAFPAAAQTINDPGCGMGSVCQLKSLALGGATIGTDALGVTGTIKASSDIATGNNFLGNGVFITTNTATLSFGAASDLKLYRAAAATLQLGGADGPSPITQTLRFQSATGNNVAGVNATIIAPLGTGTGVPGDLIFQTGTAVASGTGASTNTTALTIKGGTQQAIFAGGVTSNGYSTNSSGSLIYWLARTVLSSPSDGVLRLANQAQTNTADLTVSGANTTGGSTVTFGGAVASTTIAAVSGSGPGGMQVGSTNAYSFSVNTTALSGTYDLQLKRAGTGSLQVYDGSANSFTVTAGASNLATFNGGITTGGTVTVIGGLTTSGNATVNGGFFALGGVTSSFPAWKRVGAALSARLADDSADAKVTALAFAFGTNTPVFSSTAPTIASGFGASPSVPNANGNAVFTVNVGTGGSASTGVLTMPTSTNGWACTINDLTTISTAVSQTKETATTATSVTIGNYTDLSVSGPWASGDVLQLKCQGY